MCAFVRIFVARFSAVFAAFSSSLSAFSCFAARFSCFFGAFARLSAFSCCLRRLLLLRRPGHHGCGSRP